MVSGVGLSIGSFCGVTVLHKCSWSSAEKLVILISGLMVGSAPRKLLLRVSSSSDDNSSGSLNRPLLHGGILGSVDISLIKQRDFDSQVCVTTLGDLNTKSPTVVCSFIRLLSSKSSNGIPPLVYLRV